MNEPPSAGQATLLNESGLPGRVYHYTSTAGFLGILQSGILHATDLRYLNDTSELSYGLTQMIRAYQVSARGDQLKFAIQLANAYGVADPERFALRDDKRTALSAGQFDPIAAAIIDSLGGGIVFGVACFCKDGDLLSQWRGYGIGGFSLGFDAHELRSVVAKRYLPLTPVKYGRPSVRETLRGISTEAFRQVETGRRQQGSREQANLTLSLLGLAAQVKDPAFKPEDELRLGDVAYSRASSLKFRSGPLGIVPYVEIDLRSKNRSLMPLREIRLAPGPEVALRETAVRALLQDNGYRLTGHEPVEVHRSSIPFRG